MEVIFAAEKYMANKLPLDGAALAEARNEVHSEAEDDNRRSGMDNVET